MKTLTKLVKVGKYVMVIIPNKVLKHENLKIGDALKLKINKIKKLI